MAGQQGIPAKWGQFVWGAMRWQQVPAGQLALAGYTDLRGTLVTGASNVGVQFYAATDAVILLAQNAVQFEASTGLRATLVAMPQYGVHFGATTDLRAPLTRMPQYQAFFVAVTAASAILSVPLDTRVQFFGFTDASLNGVVADYGQVLFHAFAGAYIEIPNVKFEQSEWVAQRDRSGRGGGSREVSPWLVWAICPRCGFRYRLAEMREEVYDQRPTGRRVCPECWDEDDPHLALNRLDLNDTGWVRDPLPQPGRDDSASYAASLYPVQWDRPLEAKLGAFFISSGGADVTTPQPPAQFNRRYLGAMQQLAEEGKHGGRRLQQWNRPRVEAFQEK